MSLVEWMEEELRTCEAKKYGGGSRKGKRELGAGNRRWWEGQYNTRVLQDQGKRKQLEAGLAGNGTGGGGGPNVGWRQLAFAGRGSRREVKGGVGTGASLQEGGVACVDLQGQS